MKPVAALCLFLLCAGAHASPTEITDPDTLKYLRAVHDALGKVSGAITTCAKEGGDRQSCVCKHESLVLEFHATVKSLLKAHPEVADYSTVNFREADGSTVAQNIPAMIRHVENPPDC